MLPFSQQLENLITQFSKLPGIGRKTSEKFVFYLVKQGKQSMEDLITALRAFEENLNFCPRCFNLTNTATTCRICNDKSRNQQLLCVVEELHDLNVIESTGKYNGVYHVLGGQLNPLDGITADKLRIKELLERVKTEKTQEIILALNPNMQGESTAIALKRALQPLGVKITQLARGLPMGADIEYADEVTLINALKNRETI
ncbi:MAG: recombination mediator RecR [Candidatus Falkowbacteria bacterium]